MLNLTYKNASAKRLAIAFLLIAYLFLALIYVQYGKLNYDEGFYSLAGLKSLSGEKLYKDFAFTQMPLSAYVYGWGQKLFGESIFGGRLTSVLISSLAMLFTLLALYNQKKSIFSLTTAGCCFLLFSYNIYYLTIIKTYSLTVLLLALILFINSLKADKKQIICGYFLVCGFLMLTRLNFLLFSALLGLYLYNRENKTTTVIGSIFFAITVSTGVLPFIIDGTENLFYFAFIFHTQRSLETSPELLYKLGVLISSVPMYVCIVILLIRAKRDEKDYLSAYGDSQETVKHLQAQNYDKNNRFPWFLLLSCIATILIAKYPQQEHFVVCIPIIAFIFGNFGDLIRKWLIIPDPLRKFAYVLVALFFLIPMPNLSNVFNKGFYPTIAYEKQIQSFIRKHTSQNDYVFTQVPSLLIGLERRYVPETELGIFSYFPHLSINEANQKNVLNKETALEKVQHYKPELIIITESSFDVVSPYILSENEDILSAFLE